MVCEPSAETTSTRAEYLPTRRAKESTATDILAGVTPERGLAEIHAGAGMFGLPPSSLTVNWAGDWVVEFTLKDCPSGESPPSPAEKARLPTEVPSWETLRTVAENVFATENCARSVARIWKVKAPAALGIPINSPVAGLRVRPAGKPAPADHV